MKLEREPVQVGEWTKNMVGLQRVSVFADGRNLRETKNIKDALVKFEESYPTGESRTRLIQDESLEPRIPQLTKFILMSNPLTVGFIDYEQSTRMDIFFPSDGKVQIIFSENIPDANRPIFGDYQSAHSLTYDESGNLAKVNILLDEAIPSIRRESDLRESLPELVNYLITAADDSEELNPHDDYYHDQAEDLNDKGAENRIRNDVKNAMERAVRKYIDPGKQVDALLFLGRSGLELDIAGQIISDMVITGNSYEETLKKFPLSFLLTAMIDGKVNDIQASNQSEIRRFLTFSSFTDTGFFYEDREVTQKNGSLNRATLDSGSTTSGEILIINDKSISFSTEGNVITIRVFNKDLSYKTFVIPLGIDSTSLRNIAEDVNADFKRIKTMHGVKFTLTSQPQA